jgi:hypothetical protein
MKTSMTEKIKLAQKAIHGGMTRGRFIATHTKKTESITVLQSWSDAYTLGMPKHKLDIEVHFLLDLDVLHERM